MSSDHDNSAEDFFEQDDNASDADRQGIRRDEGSKNSSDFESSSCSKEESPSRNASKSDFESDNGKGESSANRNASKSVGSRSDNASERGAADSEEETPEAAAPEEHIVAGKMQRVAELTIALRRESSDTRAREVDEVGEAGQLGEVVVANETTRKDNEKSTANGTPRDDSKDTTENPTFSTIAISIPAQSLKRGDGRHFQHRSGSKRNEDSPMKREASTNRRGNSKQKEIAEGMAASTNRREHSKQKATGTPRKCPPPLDVESTTEPDSPKSQHSPESRGVLVLPPVDDDRLAQIAIGTPSLAYVQKFKSVRRRLDDLPKKSPLATRALERLKLRPIKDTRAASRLVSWSKPTPRPWLANTPRLERPWLPNTLRLSFQSNGFQSNGFNRSYRQN